MTPIKIVICLLCIAFLFSETAFGICIGCIVYHKTQKNAPMYCPGNVCEIKPKEKIQQFSKGQFTVLLLFFVGIFAVSNVMMNDHTSSNDSYVISKMKCETGKCGGNM